MKTFTIVWTESIARTTAIQAETEEEARNKLIEQVGYGFHSILSATEQKEEVFVLARHNKASGKMTYYSEEGIMFWIFDKHQAKAKPAKLWWSDTFLPDLKRCYPNEHFSLQKI